MRRLRLPGVSNAWTMPIKARIDMLATGIRTPVGVKVFGPDLRELERLGDRDRARRQGRARHHQRLRRTAARRPLFEITPDRAAAARYGLAIGDIQEVIATALGGRSSRPRSKAASATASSCATRAIFATTRRPSRPGAGADHDRRHGATWPGRRASR